MNKYNLPEISPSKIGTSDKFKLRVFSVDQNETINDNQIDYRMKGQSKENNRGLRVAGWAIEGGNNTAFIDVLLPVSNLGEFTVPQPGDIIWVEFSKRGNLSEQAVKIYSTYDNDAPEDGGNPVPLWGSQPGDYGYLHSYKHHNLQFSSKPKEHKIDTAPTEGNVDFRTKWVASITGTRFRRFYKSSIQPGKFVLRGDSVFDIDTQNINKEIVIADGVDLLKGQGITEERHKYPLPLNTPAKREEDESMVFNYVKHRYLTNAVMNDPLKSTQQPVAKKDKHVFKLKTKNHHSYEPIMDKSYRESTRGFERELQSVDEWSAVLKGNNKIVLQDVSGDGNQLFAVFKNAVDAGLSLVQNEEIGSVRLRDNLGQNLFFEGDAKNPRIVLMTSERQKLEMGKLDGKGSYILLRNGQVWGDSDTSWGTKTGKGMGDVLNQEFLFVDNKALLADSAFLEYLSPGMSGLVSGKGEGFYYKMADPAGDFEQQQSMYHLSGDLKKEEKQLWKPKGTSVTTKSEVNGSGEEVLFSSESILKGKPVHKMKADSSTFLLEKYIKLTGKKVGFIELTEQGIDAEVEKDFTINVGTQAKAINIGGPKTSIDIKASNLVILAKVMDILKG